MLDWFFGAKKPVNTRNDTQEDQEEETKVQNIEITQTSFLGRYAGGTGGSGRTADDIQTAQEGVSNGEMSEADQVEESYGLPK